MDLSRDSKSWIRPLAIFMSTMIPVFIVYAAAPSDAPVPPPAPSAAADAARDEAIKSSIPSSNSNDELNKQAIRDQVKVLRQQRYETMPYLDRSIVRAQINPEKVRDKVEFISSGQKDLHELIRRAVSIYTPARAAHERVSLAKRRILVALRAMFPELTFETQERTGNLSSSGFNSRNYKYQIKIPVFHGGILWNTLLQEKSGLEAAQKEYDKVIHDLVHDISAAYFEYNRTVQVMNDQETMLQRMKKYLDISKQKFNEQIISEIESLNVQSLYGQLEYDHETAKQELELAKLDLQKYLDLQIHDNIDVAPLYDVDQVVAKMGYQEENNYQPQPQQGEQQQDQQQSAPPVPVQPSAVETAVNPLEASVVVPAVDELVDLAYENRPELQIEAAKLDAARHAERVQWGEMVPHADISIDFGKLGEAFDQDDETPSMRRDYRMLLEVTWNGFGNKISYAHEHNEQPPSVSQFLAGSGSQISRNTLSVGLFDGLEQFAGIKEAEVQKLDQIVALEKAEKEVIQEVKQAYFDYQKALISVKSSIQRMDYRQRLARLAEHRLGQNEIQISEYLQAELDYLRETSEFHKALRDYYTAKAKLNRAIGKTDFLSTEGLHGK